MKLKLLRTFKINRTVWEIFEVDDCCYLVQKNDVIFTNGNTCKDGFFESETECEINIMMEYAVDTEGSDEGF